jgi:hypothetical protein
MSGGTGYHHALFRHRWERLPKVDRAKSERPSRIQGQLDGMVVNIELTLISIIQGVALYFLADSSRSLIVNVQMTHWPYVLTGLLVILLFWLRSLIHTLTLIRWPLEFGHNFMYVACTLVEAVMFSQVGDPKNWFVVGAAYAVVATILFAVDMRMIRKRMTENVGPAERALLDTVKEEQMLDIRLAMPAAAAFCALAAAAIGYWPDFFIERRGHLVFGLLQLGAAVEYLYWVLKFYARLTPLILATREEWSLRVREAGPVDTEA